MIQQNSMKKLLILGAMVLCAILLVVAPGQVLAQSIPGYNPLDNPAATGVMPGFPLVLNQEVDFPALTGPYAVGRTAYRLIDDSRPDIYTPCPVGQVCDPESREFMIWVHYPVDPTAVPPGMPPAPYLIDPLRTVLAQGGMIAGGNPATFDLIHSHAYMSIPGVLNIPVAAAGTPYPVVLFSHGKNMHPLFYTAMLEELASQGYIVVSVVHPHDALTSVLFDLSNPNPAEFKLLTPPTGDENDLTRQAAAGDQSAIDALASYEVLSHPGDLLFTLGYLQQLNETDPILSGHLNLQLVGAYGHSFGAGTVVWASQVNPQIQATIAMDPTILPFAFEETTPPLSQAFMFMRGAGAECGSPILPIGYWEVLQQFNCANAMYGMQSQPFYYFMLDTSTHQTFMSDLVLLAPALEGFDPYMGGVDPHTGELNIPIIGIDNERAVEILNTYISAFFNQELRGETVALLDGPSQEYCEVQFLNQPLATPFACSIPSIDPPPGGGGGDPYVVPEPGTMTLMGLGLLGLLALARKMRRKG